MYYPSFGSLHLRLSLDMDVAIVLLLPELTLSCRVAAYILDLDHQLGHFRLRNSFTFCLDSYLDFDFPGLFQDFSGFAFQVYPS